MDNRSSTIRILLMLKLSQLQREELPTLTYVNLLDYLFKMHWKNDFPETLNEICSDVLSIKASDIVAYLSYQALVDGKNSSLDDFSELL